MRKTPLPFRTTYELIAQAKTAQYHLLPDATGMPVSSKSLWEEEAWALDGAYSRVIWKFKMHDGTFFTDPQHAVRLDHSKRFLWSTFVDSRDGRQWTHRGAVTRLSALRRLVRWMYKRSYADFSQLDADAFNQFKEDLVEELALAETADDDELLLTEESEDGFDSEPPDEDDRQGRLRNASVLRACFALWQKLWWQSAALGEGGGPAMQEDPLGGRSILAVSRDVVSSVIRSIPPLPDEVALPIMNEAHRWLAVRADDIIRLHEQYIAALEKLHSEGRSLYRRKKKDTIPSFDFDFSIENGEQTPWHAPLRAGPVPVRVYGKPHRVIKNGRCPVLTDYVRTLVETVMAACSIVIQSETGMRINELAAISLGEDAKGYPLSPIEMELSKSGLNQLFFINSIVRKTERVPRAETWLAGSRPVGSTFVSGPVRAIEVLQALLAPRRRLAEDAEVKHALFVTTTSHGRLSVNPSVFYAATRESLRMRQKWFIEQYVDLSGLADKSRLGEDLNRYRDSKGKCITTHQWRKTYAMYVIRTDPRMVPPIAMQFKHLSVAMTESAYISKDPSLMREFETQQARSAAAFVYRTVSGKEPVAGRIAKLIDEWAEDIRKTIGDIQSTQAINALQIMCEDRGILAYDSPHGKCFIRLNPVEARCHQNAGTAHWAQRRPNFNHRAPDVCNGCACFGVDRDHLPFWEYRYIEHQTAWNEAKARGLETGFRMIRERAQQSATMLRALGAELPVIPGESHA